MGPSSGRPGSSSATCTSTRRSKRVWRGEADVGLSAKEFALLETFIRRPGQVLDRFQLLEHALDYEYVNRSNVVDVYLHYLREQSTGRSGSSRSRRSAARATECARTAAGPERGRPPAQLPQSPGGSGGQ